MAYRFLLACLIVALAAGCKRQESVAPRPANPATPSVETPPGAPVAEVTGQVVIEGNDDMNQTLQKLTDELRAYVGNTRSRPKDFADFAAKDHLQCPPPPAGKAYAIQGPKVVLVNQ